MMNIGVFVRSLNKGGAENQSILLSKLLSKGNNVKLIVLFKEGELIARAKEELKNNIIFIDGDNYISKSIYLFAYFKKAKFDTLFCYLPSNNILGTIIGKIAGVKSIIGGLRGAEIKDNKLKMIIQKLLLNYAADAVISNSHKAKETYTNFGFKKEKIHVIHNSIELNESTIIRSDKKKISILTVARFAREKDFKTALRSIKELLQNLQIRYNIEYVIVGYGEKEKLIRSYIKELGIDDYVNIVLNPSDLNQYYKQADIFLLTSIYEGMPNVIMEAMNWSLPVVSTNAGDISYLVKNGINGFVCEKKDFKSIALKLEQLVSSNQLRDRFGQNGYEILRKNYSPDKFVEKYQNIIDSYSK